jgi:hypothetical protein
MAFATTPHPQSALSHTNQAVQWTAAGLVLASWISAGLFGLYILAFYLGAIPRQRLELWNSNLPGMYEPGKTIALIAMAAHLATGGIILILGPIQLIDRVRRASPRLHRYIGRVYVFTSAIAGIGGLGFILGKGTIGGSVMNVGFGIYGVLMVVAAFETMRHARAGRFTIHRAWAVRLFALAIGSWLYRMDYGFWFIVMGKLGHTPNFRGVFDDVMVFFFYVPNLVVAEMFLRERRGSPGTHPLLQTALTAIFAMATVLVAIGTYYFAKLYWLPGIAAGLTGSS